MEIIKNGSWLEIAENVNIEMTCGVLKGWVLGPSLWNLYYDDVFRLRIPVGTELIISYADDLVMVVSSKDVPTLIRNTEQAALRMAAKSRTANGGRQNEAGYICRQKIVKKPSIQDRRSGDKK